MLKIGWVANPRRWARWQEAEALLKPAKARGEFESVLDPDEVLWAVLDGGDLLAVATAWLGVGDQGRFVEIKLIGGRDRHRWLNELDNVIGAAAKDAGASRLMAIGRAGWWRDLRHMGWAKAGETDPKTWVYSREV